MLVWSKYNRTLSFSEFLRQCNELLRHAHKELEQASSLKRPLYSEFSIVIYLDMTFENLCLAKLQGQNSVVA